MLSGLSQGLKIQEGTYYCDPLPPPPPLQQAWLLNMFKMFSFQFCKYLSWKNYRTHAIISHDCVFKDDFFLEIMVHWKQKQNKQNQDYAGDKIGH